MNVINKILYDKKQGIDCTEQESAYIKGWLRETIINPEDGSQQVLEEIQILFPLEYGEYLDESATPSPLPETETGVKQDWEAFEKEINELEAALWNQPTGAPPTGKAETGVSIDTPTEAAEVFEYLDGPDGNFASESAPKGWETGAPPTPGNEREGEGFTGGEWFIEENVNHYPFIMGEDNNLIAMLIDGKDGSLFYGRSLEETKANARLIASAQDMFRFIKEMAERYANSEWIAGEANKIINSITGGK